MSPRAYRQMVSDTQVAVEQRKSRRASRTGGTCNKRLNAHSLLREICIGELLTPSSFHVIFKTVKLTRHYIYQEQESFV